MLEKGLHCFSKYHHIYEFIGTGQKTWKEIKRHLVKDIGVKESTSRAQMEVALAAKNKVVIEEDGLYRLNPELILELLKFFRPLYPQTLRIITQSKYKQMELAGREWEIKYLKLLCEKLELEYGYHDMKASYYANKSYSLDRNRLASEHRSKAVHAHHELNDLKKRLEKEGIKLDE